MQKRLERDNLRSSHGGSIAIQEGCDMKPVLDPARDLAGATPETLARALLRPLGPRPAREPVVGDEVPVEEVAPDQLRDSVAHLDERS